MLEVALPKNWSDLADEELGSTILGVFIMDEAEKLGIPLDGIPMDFGAIVIKRLLTLETSNVALVPLEKALHKAAQGHFEEAGRLFREDIHRCAIEYRFVPIGIKKSKQASDFGRRGAESKKSIGEANRERILRAALKILGNRLREPSDRELAELIARQVGLAESTIRRHLRVLRQEAKLD